MSVLVTGAHGRVGSTITEYLGDDTEYEFTLLDLHDHPDHDTYVADIREYDDIRPAFDGQSVVVHLAAALSRDEWSNLVECNINGMYNVMKAASEANVEKVIFASSNHVVGTSQIEHSPELYHPDYDLTVTDTAPPRPKSIYGATKMFGETLGRYYIDHRAAPSKFYALRICGVRGSENDHPYGDAEIGVATGSWERGSIPYWEQVAKRMAMGTSRRDFSHVIECCLEEDSFNYGVFNVTSDNEAGWFDIRPTREILGYEPQDDMGNWSKPLPDEVPEDVPDYVPDWMPRK